MNKILFLLAAFGLILLAACNSDQTPEERYRRELAYSQKASASTNKVFLGLELGMPRRGYFDRCTVLNGDKLITMAGNGNAVDYKLSEELPRPATLTLSPDFGEDRKSIKAMDFLVTYDDWAPWNKDSQAERLLQDLYPFLKEEFGENFFVFSHEKLGSVLVQFNNNRRIAAWVMDPRYVQIRITDLRVLPEDELG